MLAISANDLPQELPLAVERALKKIPGRPIILVARVVQILGRTEGSSDSRGSVLLLEASFSGQILTGACCVEPNPEVAASQWFDLGVPVMIVTGVETVEAAKFLLGEIKLLPKGADAYRGVVELEEMLAEHEAYLASIEPRLRHLR